MESRRSFRFSAQVFLGSIVVILGILFTLDNLDLLDAGEYLRLWPALLVIYGLWKTVTSDTTAGKAWGVFWIFVGGVWLLDKLDVIYVSIWDFWPLILVFIGGSMLLGSRRRLRHLAIGSGVQATDSNATISTVAILGGFKRSNDSQDFRGGEATAIMGGCEIDLRRASIKEGDAVLDVFAFWGGIEVRVPEDWTVVLEGVPLLGGFEDRTHPPKEETRKRFVVKGYAIMGGVEIKN